MPIPPQAPLDRQTIDGFAQRSNRYVMRFTFWTAFAVILSSFMAIVFNTYAGYFLGLVGCILGPLCFMTIPAIHFLCRRVRELETRLAALEQPSEDRPTPQMMSNTI